MGIIRWIAEITGVAEKIRKEAYKDVGGRMENFAHWFTGGLMVEGHKYDMSNILYSYPKECLNKGVAGLMGNQQMSLRAELWELSDKGKSIIVEENKNGKL